jgi:hypothetical protein
MEQLNIDTDIMVKRKMDTMLARNNWDSSRPLHLPSKKIEIYWTNRRQICTKVSSTLTKTLLHRLQTISIRQYWIKKSKLSNHTESYIDWTASAKSQKNIPKCRQQWLSKWITGFCGTSVKLKLYKYQSHSKYPSCETDNEDTNHILRRPQNDAHTLCDHSLLDLEQWMIQNNGHPELIEIIILGLTTLHNDNRLPLTYEILEPTLRQAWTKQCRIGWGSFIEGYWALEWQQCQSVYLIHINSRKSSLLWISRVQRRIWLMAWNMWEHRNNFLHNDGTTIHTYETRAINEEIREEWTTGLGQLSPTYNHLFNGDLQHRLDDTINNNPM